MDKKITPFREQVQALLFSKRNNPSAWDEYKGLDAEKVKRGLVDDLIQAGANNTEDVESVFKLLGIEWTDTEEDFSMLQFRNRQ